MKPLIFINFLVLLLVGCFPSGHPQWRHHAIPLTNGLGTLQVDLIQDMDTLLQWKNQSDAKCEDMQAYRVQPKQFPVYEETGWFYDEPDSSFSFTVSHLFFSDCANREAFNADTALMTMVAKEKSIEPDCIIKMAKVYTDKNKKLAVFAFKINNPQKKYSYYKLEAKDLVNNCLMNFTFKRNTNLPYPNGDFLQDSYAMLQTISIK